MHVPFLDLANQEQAILDATDAATRRVVRSGRYVLGETVESFESAFAKTVGARHCIGVGSGTDALTLALRALGIGAGDEVIAPANTCVPTIAAIDATGATPVLSDVDDDSLTLDPGVLEGALTPRTRAVVPVHIYGQCADMDPILAFARAHDLLVVEDAAHAHGARYGPASAGNLADAAAFSFYPTKNLGAIGDAGAVTTSDDEVASRVRRLRSHGEDGEGNAIERSTNTRLDAIQAAVLLAKLPHLDRWNDRRRAIATRYRASLAPTHLRLPTPMPRREHVFHLFVVRVPERQKLREALFHRGVETFAHYPRAIHQHPAYAELARTRAGLGRSERAAAEVLSLPLHQRLTDADAEHVIYAVEEALGVA